MKPFYDLTNVAALNGFPWQSTIEGLARARKTVSTFYGDVHSTKFSHEQDKRWTDKDSWRWYNSLAHGVNVEGFNVNLNTVKSMGLADFWWAKNHLDIWMDIDNMRHFQALQQWIKSSGIFKHTGRQLFFIQIAGQGSPIHTDFDPQRVPEELRKPSEFIWLTPPDRPKQLTVGGEQVPWCTWFNHFVPHGAPPEQDTRWSLRIDGEFTESFRHNHIYGQLV